MLTRQTYFYKFLEPVSKELATIARELEHSIFTSPRTMLTHARTFMEAIIDKVLVTEHISFQIYTSLIEKLDNLDEQGIITSEVRDALHVVRKNGNLAAHDVRPFRYSEALLSWEALHTIVSWYVEVYGPLEMKTPDYHDPEPSIQESYDMAELQIRFENMEKLFKNSFQKFLMQTPEEAEVAATIQEVENFSEEENVTPGMTTIRTIYYGTDSINVPHFLRDAFLLPQRFEKSELFLIRLGGEQQARIMSELPENIEGLHTYVKRYNETNDKNLFEELKIFIKEEKKRREIKLIRPGELFLFYKEDYIIVTEKLSQVSLDKNEFDGIPSLLRQLNEFGIEYVGQLPQELVTLAKYRNVGIGTVEKLFEQLKAKVK
ncbi:DUF4145 domain-containing protein [Paucisalibacillus sp. EB02]|uniref:DUF4145 domain-containing protein n=1 Tax=Paucisalibacillus sp. EB02 TaxID=1347087 RepID=UPI0004BB2C53|nr:DUF4145 domain-containing protein [Paucisalibacillus sp. EB02]